MSVAPGAMAGEKFRACLLVIAARIRIHGRAASMLSPHGDNQNRDCCPAKSCHLEIIYNHGSSMGNATLKGVMIGAGFFARFQAEAWTRIAGVELAAVADPAPGRAAALAAEYGIPH